MDISKLTGLQLLQAIANGELDSPNMAKTIPMDFVQISEGEVLFHVRADTRHLNPLGGVHGGFAATVLDSVTGCAVHSMLEAGVGFGTVELDVKMMRPVPVDTKMIATGKLISLTKSIGFAEGKMTDVAGKIFAHATATCMIIRHGRDR